MRLFLANAKATPEIDVARYTNQLTALAQRDGLVVEVTTARDHWEARYRAAGSIGSWIYEIVNSGFAAVVVPGDGCVGRITAKIVTGALARRLRVLWLAPWGELQPVQEIRIVDTERWRDGWQLVGRA